MRGKPTGVWLGLLAVVCLSGATPNAPGVRFIPFSDAQPVLEALVDSVPEPLRAMPREERGAAWPRWVAARDREIRARLERGEEDTLTNFMLFGTTFTHQPRVTLAMLDRARGNPAEALAPGSRLAAAVRARADDLATGAAAPVQNERLAFAKRVLERNGYSLGTSAEQSKARDYLLQHFEEVLRENERFAELLKAAHTHSHNEELVTRSTLFQSRGVSLDTSWQPNFAIEQSLATLKAKEMLRPAGVRRVAVIGPGLDFTDKEEGYDFYPPQTIQPFALFDSLVRLGLASGDALEIMTLDLSTRVNDHIARARERAQAGTGYTIQLPLDLSARWKPDAMAYWKEWGSRVSASAAPAKPPAEVGAVETRALLVKPEVVLRVTPGDLNVVLEQLEFKDPGERFDLVIATNVLVYYDLFEQGLALQNIGAMLKPGGFFLSNDALVQIAGCALHSMGTATATYSERKEDADYIIWYRKETAGKQ